MKQCPFCKSDNLRVEEDVVSMRDGKFEFYVLCKDCKAKGSTASNKSLAIDLWDKSFDESEIQKIIELSLFTEDKKELLC